MLIQVTVIQDKLKVVYVFHISFKIKYLWCMFKVVDKFITTVDIILISQITKDGFTFNIN